MSHFAENLRNYLDSKELSSHRLAMDLGIPPAVMSKVLTGKRKPPKKFIEALAEAAEVQLSLDELKAWKLLDEYSESQILLAAKHM